jgi:hypothetical protein
MAGLFSSIGQGAAGGAAGGPGGMLAGAALAAIPSIFGAVRGIGQRRQAKRIRANAVDPGYELNSGVMQNADILKNRYNNYSLPGYSMQMNRIGTNAATAFDAGSRGASSGGDILDLATKIAYGTGQQQNDLVMQNAQGKEDALGGFLNANAAAGQERQNANAYEREQYMNKLQEAAALYGASDQNLNNASIGLGSIGSTLAMDGATYGTPRNKRYNPIKIKGKSVGVTNTGFPNTQPIIPLPN